MLYNIWLEVAATIFIFVIWFFYRTQYQHVNEINKRFEILTISLFMLSLTDIISAVGISYYYNVPIWLNYLMNGLNYIFVGISAYAFVRYIRTLVDRKNTPFAHFEHILTIAYVLSEFLNTFGGFFFTFDSTGYHHGPLYILPLLVSYFYVVDTAVLLFLYRSSLDRRKIIGTACYILMMLNAGGVQIFIAPSFLLTGFFSSIMLLTIYMLMETPDYYRLLSTMSELEEAKNEANKANEAKSRFLANMSHEIRTPLNTVLGMDEMILREEKDPAILDYAINIKSSGNALLGLINDILDFSKIESGLMSFNPIEYSIAATAANAYTMLSQKASDKNLELTVSVDSNMPKALYGDEKCISQIIINLVNNAIKYTESGSVKLAITEKPSPESGTILLCITVSDTGIGIREADKELLFKEFERLDLDRNRNIEGTGLGLALISRLTKGMNGTVTCDSIYGKGSTFRVEIPQQVRDNSPIGEFSLKPRKSSAEKYQCAFRAPQARILAVDDNRVNLVVLKNYLKYSEVQFTSVLSGAAALDKLEKEEFDIVFVDHMMPEMDGIETLHRAKELEKSTGRHAIYVVLTANAIQGVESQYLTEGFDAYLSKPINSKDLDDTLLQYLPKELVEML